MTKRRQELPMIPVKAGALSRRMLNFKPHPRQHDILAHKARYKVVACGRRFGKTEIGKLLLVENALMGKQGWFISPTYRTASGTWRELKAAARELSRLLDASPDEVMQIDGTDKVITFEGGGLMAVRSAGSLDNLRGSGLDLVVFDEAAFIRREVWDEVVRPMLLERKGRAVFLSTPAGRNWFYDVHVRGKQPPHEEWMSFQYPSTENPLVDPAELEKLRMNTREAVFRAEYLAEFVLDEGLVFRGIAQAVDPTLRQARRQRDHTYVMGVDWGKSYDYTVLVVMDATDRAVVAIERFHQVEWSLQRGRLRHMYDQWGVQLVMAEANAMGEPNIEALRQEGMAVRGFAMTAASKPPLIEALALALERGRVRLLAHEAMIGELGQYGVQKTANGYRYSAPPGEHDDCVIALALAWHAAETGGVRIGFA